MEKLGMNVQENGASASSKLVKMITDAGRKNEMESKPAQKKYKRINHLYKLL